MLRQCEFNGRQDVLHFKLLQAAINKNNVDKTSDRISNQIEQNSAENSMVSKNYLDENRERESYREQAENGIQYHPNTNQYQPQNQHYDINHGSRQKKRRISSPMSVSEPRSKRKHQNSLMSKSKPMNQLTRALPLSKNKKMLNSSRGMLGNTTKHAKKRFNFHTTMAKI